MDVDIRIAIYTYITNSSNTDDIRTFMIKKNIALLNTRTTVSVP